MAKPKIVKAVEDMEEAVFADELEPGQTLLDGQFTITSFLNAGGFGITYRAKDSLKRNVVIKECFPGSFCRRANKSVMARSQSHKKELSSIVRLFVQEARSLAKLDHPNIVGVHQVFEENNTAYMALDFVEGRDLLDMIEEPSDDALEPDQIETILRKMLDAVGFIHDQGVLHRDISPDNILIQPNMEPTLIDFGAAREEAGKQSRILSALRVVKDGYSPQEFYISGATQGNFSDLYALAATFYHLITGDLPANSQSRLAAVAAGGTDPYVPVVGRMPAYSEPFLIGIDKALEILPKDRIASAADWLDLLNGTEGVIGLKAPAAVASSKGAAFKATTTPAPANSNKTKVRLLSGVALLVPVLGGLIVMQSGGSTTPDVIEPTTVLLAPTAPVTIAAADPAPELAPELVPELVPEPSVDLGALLGTATPVTQPADTSPEALANAEPTSAIAVPVPAQAAPPALDLSAVLGTSTPTIQSTDTSAAIEIAIEPASPTEAPVIATATQPEPPTVDLSAMLGVSSPTVQLDATPLETPTVIAATPAESFFDGLALGLYNMPSPVVETAVAEATAPDTPLDAIPDAQPVIATYAAITNADDIVPANMVPAPKIVPEIAPEILVASPAPIATPDDTVVDVAAAPPVIAPIADIDVIEDVAPVLTATVLDTPAPVPAAQIDIESFDMPQVMSVWSVELTNALPVGSDTIYAINDLPIDRVDQLDTALHKLMQAPDGATMDLAVLVGETPDAAVVETLTVPVVQKTLFLNGTLFETRMIDGVWTTVVAEVPAGREFELGDTLVGDLGSGVVFETRTTLPELLMQANAENLDRLTLAVRRGDIVIPINLTVPG